MKRGYTILKNKLLTGFITYILICLGLLVLISIPVVSVTLVPSNPMPSALINGTVNFTVTDSDADATEIELWIDGEYFADLRYDGSTYWYYELNTFALEDGPHFIQYKGYKSSGLDDVYGFAVFIDNNGPELSGFEVIYPPPQEVARWGDAVFFQVYAEDEMGVAMVMVNCSSFNFTAPIGPMFDDGFHQDDQVGDDYYGSDPFGVDAFFTGLFIVNISAQDTVGNFNNQSYLIEIDNMWPVVFNTNITYPPGQSAAKFGDQIRVTAMAFDMGMVGGILGVTADCSNINGSNNEVMYDDGLHGDAFEGDGLYGTDWVTVGTHDNGFQSIGVSAYDIALNMNQNVAVINLDNRAPIIMKIKIRYPNNQGYASDGDRINVSATIIDDQGPFAITWYYLDASAVGGSYQMENTSIFRWDGVLVSVGYTRSSPYVTVHVFDHANNEGTLSAIVNVDADIRRAPTVTVKSPNGGENWMDGDYYPITWVADGNLGPRPISLYYSTDNGQTWKPIAIDIPNTGYYNWTVPNDETAGALIRVNVTDIYNYNVSDTSDASFSIDPPPPQYVYQPEESEPVVPNNNNAQPETTKELDEPKAESESNTLSSNPGIEFGLVMGIAVVIIISLVLSILYMVMRSKSKGSNRESKKNTIRLMQNKKKV